MKKELILISFALLLVACGGEVKKSEKTEVKKFEYVVVPPMMSDPTEVANFKAAHFWDKFDFTDTAYISLPAVLEQAIADYVDMLSRVDSTTSAKSIAEVIKKSEADTAMFRYMTDNLLSYVGDPNSPLRNDILYINALKAMITNPNVDTTECIAYAHKLKMNSKNMRGTRATNFNYFTRNGSKGSLNGIKSDYTIIFFNHIGCEGCAGVKAQFESDPILNAMLKSKKLTLLGIFPDEDKSEWISGNNEFDPLWINATDTNSDIEKKELYYVPAIPSLYLLDKDKTILLKDANAGDVLMVLHQIANNPQQ